MSTEISNHPKVVGIAIMVNVNTDLAKLLSHLNATYLDITWSIPVVDGRWLKGSLSESIALKDGWNQVRKLRLVSGVAKVEPLLEFIQPISTGAEVQQQFKLWGKIAPTDLQQIQDKSNASCTWSLEALGVCNKDGSGGAWALWQTKYPGKEPGEGVLIAHPDTGYTKHPRLLGHLDGENHHGKDFVEANKPDALDPLSDGFAEFPGHGTGTGSVIVGSKGDDKPWGVAPGATLLPLRVSRSVIHLNFDHLSEALKEATEKGAQVVSMSLGGPVNSGLLEEQIANALDQGVILIAAAGNYAPTVIFPARVPGVIACAASNVLDSPWRFSGLGAEVAITAPGELVWHAQTTKNSAVKVNFDEVTGSGTSFATANVAGLAALWLSYHGRATLIQKYTAPLLAYAFRVALEDCARPFKKIDKPNEFGLGAGIPVADKLLSNPLPEKSAVEDRKTEILRDSGGFLIGFPLHTWWSIATMPTLAEGKPVVPVSSDGYEAAAGVIEAFLKNLVGDSLDDDDRAELGVLASTDLGMSNALVKVANRGRGAVSGSAIRRYLLNGKSLSTALKGKLEVSRAVARTDYLIAHPELDGVSFEISHSSGTGMFQVEEPKARRLQVFAFDPSLATRTETALVNELTVSVVFEKNLQPGPTGDYLEVVDVDPASDCVYAPVDLNHPYLLAQDGLRRSESNPQFHQQMVYAVGMRTIAHFEEALGRPIFWSSLRNWDKDKDLVLPSNDPDEKQNQFVQRLRLYPHALREQNAYYSPQKRAILFGYFPADDTNPGAEYPGGIVFTCLAHDIIAHEMTHAILDGMHVFFTESTNPDVFAFHEAFADLVALFQRFSYPELLRDQIGRSRGQLDSGTLLSQLALQFGQATGRRSALRDALRRSDPLQVTSVFEPHERGSLLVAAVFDAYLNIYNGRIADLRRIATGGTGILPDGDLHPDLVNRMADEAARSARHVLRMCIRAMDYTPPVDITFGEFLRAIITADYDLVPADPRRYRLAFIDAFRKWGIYPRNVRTLSEETLRWSPPPDGVSLFPGISEQDDEKEAPLEAKALRRTRRALLKWKPGMKREEIFEDLQKAQSSLHVYFRNHRTQDHIKSMMDGIDLERSFEVTNLRPARRIGPNGEFLTELVVEIIQEREIGLTIPFRGGVTLVVSMDDASFKVRYAIRKRAYNTDREATQRAFLLGAAGSGSDVAEYSSENLPIDWASLRTTHREGMRGSSCNCRAKQMDKKAAKEPFALLHHGG